MPKNRQYKRVIRKRYRTFDTKTKQRLEKNEKELKLIEQIAKIGAVTTRLRSQPLAELLHNEEMLRLHNLISPLMKSEKNIFQTILDSYYGKVSKKRNWK